MKTLYTAYLLFLLIGFFYNPVYSQSRMQIIEMEREADMNFKMNNFKEALRLYLKLDSIKPNTPDYYYPIGVCYLSADDNLNALNYLEKFSANTKQLPIAFHYYIARAYHLSHRFDEAIKHYNIYLDQFKNKKGEKSATLVSEVQRDIEMCYNGKELTQNPLEIKIINLGPEINTVYPEYAPVISTDETELIFTSSRPETFGGRIDPIDGNYYEDIYISYKKNGKWTKPVQMSMDINSTGHDASIALSPDGQTLLLYKFDETQKNGQASGDIYISKLQGKTWGKAEKLSDKINSPAWEPSASITENGNIIYFASNKPGGYGGTDLYYSKKLPNGQWSDAINLGSTINTKYDEDCPFIHPDGKTLYFSSKGHKSMGGFDIFISRYDEEKKTWSAPENIGYPISTAHDDLHFTLSADARRIYFSTTRPDGYGGKDIYYADIKKEAAKVMLVHGIVYDSVNKKYPPAKIRVNNKSTSEEIGLFYSNSATGKYSFVLNEGIEYEVYYTAPNYKPHYENINLTQAAEYKDLEKNIYLTPPSERLVKLIVSDSASSKGLKVKIKLLNLDTNDERILPETAGNDGIYIARLLEGNKYNVEISSYRGYSFYNDEIIIPISNTNPPADTPQFNIKLRPLRTGTSILLKNIYFEFDKYTLPIGADEELNKVVELLKVNPNIFMEIAAHTDDQGSESYNLTLSEKRASEIVKYLAKNGISPSRLKAIGYGYSKPISKDTSEEARAMNRRVELRIIDIK
ncbi:MAG: OmpA family protein [Cytophagaceae bacterium]|nr:OmpA family protein [Cytophagaceae bacterium]MDW8456998.1 OmpA family protein [Cytophagaceae bacterium]